MWDGENLDGWHLSEKLDGCRCFWDGAQMWTRSGAVVALPEWFRDQLPAIALDGEIWAGRGEFDKASQAVRLGAFDDSIRFMVFDTPAPGDWLARMAVARGALDGSAVAECVEILPPMAHEEIFELRYRIHDAGGEGLIARRPGAPYRIGRSGDTLKVKDQACFMLASEERKRGHLVTR